MTGAAKIPTGATRLDVMIGALENDIAALRKQNDALVAALTLIAYRYESGDIGDLVNDMPEIEAALEQVK